MGEFKGNDEYGFGADNTKLDVEVWWAGSGTGVKEEDEKYLPSTKEPPAEDEHHKLLGTYTYDLQQLIQREGKGFNGRLDILVGGGDAGSPLADGSNFTITADETRLLRVHRQVRRMRPREGVHQRLRQPVRGHVRQQGHAHAHPVVQHQAGHSEGGRGDARHRYHQRQPATATAR